MNDKIEKLFSLSGPFEKLLPDYNFRESQLNMALSVWNSLENSNRIFIEAPTGVGKSLAYLVPAVLYSILSEEKIIISTETKTLQYQLIEKDIPLVKKALLEIDIDFKAEAAFGVNNYLCRRRFENPRTGEINFLEITDQIRNQSDNFKWGTNDEISSLIKSKDLKKYWHEINRESEYCLKSKCRYFKICYFYKMKRAIARSDIIIVNNYLFFTNIISNYTVLPEFSAVIFDEAHNLEKIATEFFSFGFSTEQVEYVLNSIFSSRKGKGILKDISLNRETKKNIESAHNKAALSINALLEVLSEFYQKRVSGSKGDFPEKLIIKNSQNKGEIKKLKEKAVEKLADYITLIENTKVFAKDSEDEMIFNAVKERLSELKNNITDFIEMKSDNFVYWMTKREKRLFTDVVCTATPVMVNRFLEKYLYDFISRIILTSATLTVQRKFSYMQERLGLKDSAALMLESPFKMKERVIEYYPELPFPGDTVNFRKKITGEITRLVKLTSGNTFVLFTSYSMMNFVHSKIENKIDLKILKQGKISRNRMISQFKKGGTVLFGTTTFWQGIDIPGDSLKQVIIVKLPFPVPTEPIIKARDELYKKEGRNFFMEYMVPETAIMVKQGYGRLIRNENDYGIISILDSRCIDKFYGKFIVSSLPGSKTRNFNDLKIFLQRFEKTS